MTFPVAEIFRSIAGEGAWAGAPMTFVRLAGCCVGVPYTPAESRFVALAPYQVRCVAWDGRRFACDTNFHMKARLTIEQILERVVGSKRVCLTGGEPLMHEGVMALIQELTAICPVHIETSGVRYQPLSLLKPKVYLAVSPKAGCLWSMVKQADEIKVLVGAEFSEEEFLQKFQGHIHRVWLQPVNSLATLDMGNVKKCVDLALRYPEIRVSVQLHKILMCQ